MILWAAIAVTLREFSQRSKLAGWLLVPDVAWVSFATTLHVAIWQLNSANLSSLSNRWLSFPHRTALAGGRAQNLQRIGARENLRKANVRTRLGLISPSVEVNTDGH